MVQALIIAGTHSSVGKTTLVVGLSAALRVRGLTVQPFKVGPDYIDPGHHSLAAGRICRNLDTWMMPVERMQSLFEKVARTADVALIEGVMGLFDGLGYEEDAGSTAHIAKLLQIPVLLVIDASKMARSAAALAKGFVCFDADVPLAGFIINRVGSEKHGQGVASAIVRATGLPVLGWLPREECLTIPERHLGLIPSAEPGRWTDYVQTAGKVVTQHLDLQQLLKLAKNVSLPEITGRPCSPQARKDTDVVIAVARDEAFHFCYEENIVLLQEAGARVEFFSPLEDEDLPGGSMGVLLSGGFPELFAERLSANQRMHAALRRAHDRRLPIYAECGGLMYLTEAIVDFAGTAHPMVGLLAGHSVMTRQLTLGYRRAQAHASSWLLQSGEIVCGHEFHYSSWKERPSDLPPAYVLLPRAGDGEPRPDGACVDNLWASYVHIHFWGNPELAHRFVSACRHVQVHAAVEGRAR